MGRFVHDGVCLVLDSTLPGQRLQSREKDVTVGDDIGIGVRACDVSRFGT